MATNRYVDSATGSNGDNGTTQALAWATIEYALESGALSAGYDVWVRRNHSETLATDIDCAYDGEVNNPIRVLCWPRPAIPNTTITQADWTNGSRVVDNVVGITPTRRDHQARWVTAPDGNKYLITAVLWEAGVDGMAGGSEFTVGERLYNGTTAQYGKLWGFTDNEDTTGTIQYVRAMTAWADNHNITGSSGGDAEIDSGGETAVGFLIEREYVGSTVTGTNGKFQIEADEWYAERPADVDGWDSDDHTLPLLDWNSANARLDLASARCHEFHGVDLINSNNSSGMVVSSGTCTYTVFRGCLFYQSNNTRTLYLGTSVTFVRFTVEGSGAGTSQKAGLIASNVRFWDGSIYNLGDVGLDGAAQMNLSNLNIGIEVQNGDDDINLTGNENDIVGSDVALGAYIGGFDPVVPYYFDFEDSAGFENFGKVLGEHTSYITGMTIAKTAVSGEYPNKKVSDYVIKITRLDANNYYITPEVFPAIFTHEFEATTDSKSYKYWIFNNTGSTINNGNAKLDIFLECEYVSAYDDTTEYVFTKQYSTQATIANRQNANDWDYLEVTSIAPAVASKVRIKCYASFDPGAAGELFIDPAVVIT